jgi:hypothetical protein
MICAVHGEGGVHATRDSFKLSQTIITIANSGAGEGEIKRMMAKYQDESWMLSR